MAEKNSINYPPSMSYSINHMWLTVEPDFDSRSIKGEEQLKLTARQDLTEIKLDCATEMKIDSVLFSLADHIDDTANNRIKLQHDPPQNDKLNHQTR